MQGNQVSDPTIKTGKGSRIRQTNLFHDEDTVIHKVLGTGKAVTKFLVKGLLTKVYCDEDKVLITKIQTKYDGDNKKQSRSNSNESYLAKIH